MHERRSNAVYIVWGHAFQELVLHKSNKVGQALAVRDPC